MNSGESTKNPLPYRHMVFYFSCLVFVVLFVFLECSKSFPTSSGHSPEHTLGSWLYLILWKTQKVEVRSPLLDAFSVADNSLPLPESPLANLFLYWFEKKKQLWRLRWPLSPDILLTRCIKCPFFLSLSMKWVSVFLYELSEGAMVLGREALALRWGTQIALFLF